MTYTNWDLVKEVEVAAGEKGIVAKRTIETGDVIGIYDGELRSFPLENGQLKDRREHKYIVQIAKTDDVLYGLYKDEARDGIGFINHSCHGNVVARDRIVLVAERTITAGEPLTIDYTKWDFVHEGIKCWCAQSRCVI
jgi:SET domain-containing protein